MRATAPGPIPSDPARKISMAALFFRSLRPHGAENGFWVLSRTPNWVLLLMEESLPVKFNATQFNAIQSNAIQSNSIVEEAVVEEAVAEEAVVEEAVVEEQVSGPP